MKVKYIELAGQKYPMCFSLTASEELDEYFGGLDKMADVLNSNSVGKISSAANKILEVLMKAGRIYVKMSGGEVPPELECKPGDLIDVSDPETIDAIFSTITHDTQREVEAKPAKKTEAAPNQ